MDYLVIDTEGGDFVDEIAIIDKKGELIYEKFFKEKDEIKECFELLQNKNLVAHSAKHDKEILEKSFKEVGLDFKANFICTFEMAKELIQIESYSLKNLSWYFDLKYNNKFFNEDLAHRASYDAIFTYKLYNKLLEIDDTKEWAKKYNPFSSSKVDNPFQDHFDYKEIYKNEFNYLTSILDEVKQDKNHQTKSVVVLGEAGSGKTHFMMRFLKNSSNTNRFLFIRQPNDEDSVIFHIYLRILESFAKKILNSEYSQLEYFLAKSISDIIITNFKNLKKPTKTQLKIIEVLEENHLNIYKKIGINQNNWKHITKYMLEWWEKNYSNNETAINLLKALIKYAQYKDKNYKESVMKYLSGYQLPQEELEKIGLQEWNHISREEFSLEAISLFGKLSIFDEPMILCFDQLESIINNDVLLKNFGEALKEIITQTPNSLIVLNLFPDRWGYFLDVFDESVTDRIGNEIISLPKLSNQEMKSLLKERAKFYNINLDYIFNPKIYQEVTKHSSIRGNINQANHYFRNKIHNVPLPKFTTNLEDKVEQLQKRVEQLEKPLNVSKVEKKEKNENIEEYIEKVYQTISEKYETFSLIDDSDENGKLKTILYTIKDIYNIEIDFFKLRKVLPAHTNMKKGDLEYSIGFLNLNRISFTSRLKNYTQLMINFPNIHFRIFRDVREDKISKNGLELIKKFNQKGRFIFMEKEDKTIFETFYQVIEDYNNKDINFKLEEIIKSLISKYPNFWLSKFLKR